MIVITKRFKWLLTLLLIGSMAFSQSGITGQALLTLSDSQGNCGLGTRNVLIEVDITGLTGTAGETVGLNCFILTFDISRPFGFITDVFATAWASSPPEMGWDFMVTERDLIDTTQKVTIVGWAADPDAFDSNYAVAELIFSGFGDITLTFDPALSSLGSRVVLSSGDGPGDIPIEIPATPFTFTLTDDYTLDLNTGFSSWLTINLDYDLIEPTGTVNLLDLVALVTCGAR